MLQGLPLSRLIQQMADGDIFLIFPRKQDSIANGNYLLETIYMKWDVKQVLFSGENKKKYIKTLFAEKFTLSAKH